MDNDELTKHVMDSDNTGDSNTDSNAKMLWFTNLAGSAVNPALVDDETEHNDTQPNSSSSGPELDMIQASPHVAEPTRVMLLGQAISLDVIPPDQISWEDCRFPTQISLDNESGLDDSTPSLISLGDLEGLGIIDDTPSIVPEEDQTKDEAILLSRPPPREAKRRVKSEPQAEKGLRERRAADYDSRSEDGDITETDDDNTTIRILSRKRARKKAKEDLPSPSPIAFVSREPGSPQWNSHFCYICGRAVEDSCSHCTFCTLSFHSTCLPSCLSISPVEVSGHPTTRSKAAKNGFAQDEVKDTQQCKIAMAAKQNEGPSPTHPAADLAGKLDQSTDSVSLPCTNSDHDETEVPQAEAAKKKACHNRPADLATSTQTETKQEPAGGPQVDDDDNNNNNNNVTELSEPGGQADKSAHSNFSQSYTDTAAISSAWRCPKCLFFGRQLTHIRPHVRANRRTYFNFPRWSRSTLVPCNDIPTPDRQSTVNILEKYGSSSTIQTKGGGRKSLGKKSFSSTSAAVTEVKMSLLSGWDFFYCLVQLAEESATRGAEVLDRLINATSQSKSDREQQSFLDYGSGVAWLLSNLIRFSGSVHGVKTICKKVAISSLERWLYRLRRQPADGAATTSLCLVEALAAARGLNPENWTATKSEYYDLININEVQSFLLNETGNSLLPEAVCPNCHEAVAEKSPFCPECDFQLPSPLLGLQFRKMTNALVWRSLCDRLDIDAGLPIQALLDEVRKFRPWRSVVELGVGNFKLQLYLVTHVLFILSNWGEYSLDSTKLAEESLLLRSSLRIVYNLDDIELTGTILQCLRLFGITWKEKESSTGWTNTSLELGIGYLLDKERRFGRQQGRFVSQGESFYDKIHGTYCAILGLTSIKDLHQGGPPLPIPSTHFEELISFFSTPAPQPLLLPGDVYRPLISIDYMSRLPVTSPMRSEQGSSSHSEKKHLHKTLPVLWLFREEQVWLSRPATATRLVNDDGFQDASASPSQSTERQKCFVRAGVVGTEWVILAQDLAVVLRLEKTLFARLISRLLLSPPRAVLKSAWPPVIHTSKSFQDPTHLHFTFPEGEDGDSNSISSGLATTISDDSKLDMKLSPCQVCSCGLTGSLVVSTKEGKIAVVLSQSLLSHLTDAVEHCLFEETMFVDLSVLKGFIKAAFADSESTSTPFATPSSSAGGALGHPSSPHEAGTKLKTPSGSSSAVSSPKQTRKKSGPRKPTSLSTAASLEEEIQDDNESCIRVSSNSWGSKRRVLRSKKRAQRKQHSGHASDSSNGASNEMTDGGQAGYITQNNSNSYVDTKLPDDALQRLIDEMEQLCERFWTAAS